MMARKGNNLIRRLYRPIRAKRRIMPKRTAFRTQIVVPMLWLALFCGCKQTPNASNGGGAVPSPTPSASSPVAAGSTQPPSPAIDPCSLFSAAEAQQIIGVPMKLSAGHGATVCMYEEASPKPGGYDVARVSLTLNVRRLAEEETRAWGNIKVVRQLKPGEK